MRNSVFWLRISYWVGAATDIFVTCLMLFSNISHSNEYNYALGLVASLMLGWSILLVWADRKPIERKAVLSFTAFPVVTGLLLAEIYAVYSGILSIEKMLPTGGVLVVLICLFSFSYFNAINIENDADIKQGKYFS